MKPTKPKFAIREELTPNPTIADVITPLKPGDQVYVLDRLWSFENQCPMIEVAGIRVGGNEVYGTFGVYRESRFDSLGRIH